MKLGRNDPCHCGSGKKYKKCCMEKDEAASRAQQERTLEYDEDFDDEAEDNMTFHADDSPSHPKPVPKDENQMDLEFFDDDDYHDDEDDEDDLAPEIDEQTA